MKIRNRILISNTLMVLISLIVLFGIGWGLINTFENDYMSIAGSRAQLDENIFLVESTLNEPLKRTSDWGLLSDSLLKYDYLLCVLEGDKIIYSNLEPEQSKALLDHQKMVVISDEHASVFYADGKTIVGKKFTYDERKYTAVALNNPALTDWFGVNRSQFEIFLIAFLLIGGASILVLLLISQLFTGMLIKHIMLPIKKLIQGTKRIELGDLSTPIDYVGGDEFAVVCNTFNQMQLHLKEEQEKNILYEKARTDMIAGISHDLRTPLTSVKGYIKGLQDGVANTPEKQSQYLAIAYKKACDMDILLNRLFYFSKLETGNLPFFIRETDLGEFIQKFVVDTKDDLERKNVKIEFIKISERHPVMIDTEEMNRVLENLVENALNYAGVDQLRLSLSVKHNNRVEQLCFSDNGRGVTSDKLTHLFEQFYRGDESRRSSDRNGSGLGLHIVKYIVEAHGGTVYAENDHGLKITINLPVEKEKTT